MTQRTILSPEESAWLREKLVKHFDEEELRTLCSDLGVDYDVLRGEGIEAKARELVAYLGRRGRIPALIKKCTDLRPNVDWETATPIPPPGPIPVFDDKIIVPRYSKKQRSLAFVGIVLISILGIAILVLDPRDIPPIRVAFKTAHDRYVSAMGADKDWLIIAQAFSIDDYERFTPLCLDNGQVALQTWHTKDGKNRFVSAMGEDYDWVLRAETNVMDNYERFTLFDTNTEKRLQCLEVIESLEAGGETIIALYTYHNRFVTAMDGNWDPPWVLRAETGVIGESEKFIMILLPDDS